MAYIFCRTVHTVRAILLYVQVEKCNCKLTLKVVYQINSPRDDDTLIILHRGECRMRGTCRNCGRLNLNCFPYYYPHKALSIPRFVGIIT